MNQLLSAFDFKQYPLAATPRGNLQFDFDVPLALGYLTLLCLGWVMVTTASLDFANHTTGSPYYYTLRQGIFALMGLGVAVAVLAIRSDFWQRHYYAVALVVLALLILVLIPGIGRVVNGSRRWIALPGFTVQVSEFAKWGCIIFFSASLVKRGAEIRKSFKAFCLPVAVIGVVALLLLAEPDFGAAVVVATTSMALIFIAGVPMRFFTPLVAAVLVLGAYAATFEEYRVKRLTSFLDPWAEENVYGSGYQLTQSLIAFGRGEWNGLGLGNSVQKLFFLPEAHTDFVFSIWAEETGFIGCMFVICLFAFVVSRCVNIGRNAAQRGALFQAYYCVGVAVVMGVQALINMGVTSGMLPTKGLTLPFISYGGSSLLICSAMLAVVLRVSYENRVATALAATQRQQAMEELERTHHG